VMASLEAAGINTPLTADGEKFRQKLKTDLQSVSPELRQKLVVFVEQYKRRHPQATNAEIVSPFISMAYTLSPAPDFSDPLRETDLPGDLLEVLDFAPLVRELYRRSLSAKLDEYVKDYQAAGDAMRPSTVKMVSDLLDYLHTRPELTYINRIKTQIKNSKGKKNLEKVELVERTRRFFIVPEMLAPKDTVNFRNIGDDYFAVVPPNTNLSASEVRRAYLQFIVDPLVLKNGKEISTVRDGIKTLLDERRKINPDVSPDVFLTVSRSLVAAIDARQIEFEKTRIGTAQARRKIDQMKTEKEKLAVSEELKNFKNGVSNETALQLSEAYEKGAVLAFYFADQLKGLEDSGFDIAGSLRDFILALDAAKETNRLAQYAEARKSALAAREERRKNPANREIVIDNPVTKKLLEIDRIISTRNFAESDRQLARLAAEYPNEARIYYAQGRVASLSAEGVTDETERDKLLVKAKKAYEAAIETTRNYPDKTTKQPDAALLSLSYVALGRLYEFAGDTGYAIKIYEAAAAVGDVPDGAYREAVAARERLIKEQ
ncbi:MAG: hypothetical protein M3T96_03915, partial [Acidobacteriota bacterium]|nr:hypothetical protein [Acidobacteriota bacterium]